jgi:DUF1365 family protein
LNSFIYYVNVTHQRFEPIKHKFNYRVFMLLLDLDELPELFDSYWLWSARKFNICYFNRKDHMGDPEIPLKKTVRDLVLDKAGIKLEGKILLLTHLRYWGYCFNPVSFYYCYDKTNSFVEVIVAEVHNTPWGETHPYILTPENNRGDKEAQRFIFPKNFHVSPLMPMNFMYDWRLTAPQEKLFVHMKNLMEEKEYFNATLSLERRELNSKNLSKTLLNHPFMTGKVILSIYWQTLKTWLKGAKFYSYLRK